MTHTLTTDQIIASAAAKTAAPLAERVLTEVQR